MAVLIALLIALAVCAPLIYVCERDAYRPPCPQCGRSH